MLAALSGWRQSLGPFALLHPSEFRALVSGQRKGLAAAAFRAALRLAETPYAAAVAWRNRRYDSGRWPVERVSVPVISVGNLTLGGSGKTPMVEWLARWLRVRDVRVTIISRGYGAEAGARNDEALELEGRLPDVPHLQDPDRVAAARLAIEEFECQAIVLDDGFQHRRLARDLDLVLVDALEPFGFGHVFPRGTLREPLAGLGRADAVALSRADLVEPADRARLKAAVERYAPHAVWLEVAHAPRRLVSAGGETRPWDELAGQRVAAFCGIGNPAGFRRTLERCGATIAGFREFPDHHAYQRSDVEDLAQWAESLDATMLVCTAKDLVKLRVERIGSAPLWAVAIELEILAGLNQFETLLESLSLWERGE
ncbi:MAG TPA: tetraacyldisaccharide 4'-kinase [Pirellulales bacterium]|nr:tetraacyldisaccharide 4'-kinase [Pirellulales bacterium]